MKKTTVILIYIVLITGFAGLVYYGLRHARGIPTVISKEKERLVLEVPFIDNDIDLSKGVSSAVWDGLSGKEIELMHQVMVLPWGKSLVSPIIVKTFHNEDDIYFYISWKDDTEDTVIDIDTFSDACAILFPLDKEAKPLSLMMGGFLGNANIWQWKVSRDKEYWLKETPEKKTDVDFYHPLEKARDVPQSAVDDLMAVGVSTITTKEKQIVSGRGIYNDGIWQVVFKRSLKVFDAEFDAAFNPGKRFAAFAVWNGSQGDRGGRKSISDWVELEVR